MDANTIKVRNPYRPPVPKKGMKSISKQEREAVMQGRYPTKKFKEEEWEGITYVRKDKNLGLGYENMYVYIKTPKGTKKCNFKRGTMISEIAIKH